MKKKMGKRGMLVLTAAIAGTTLLTRTGFTKTPRAAAIASDSAALPSLLSVADALYEKAGLAATGIKKQVFKRAYQGYLELKQKGQLTKSLLTIADMSRPSGEKRLLIIDVEKQVLVKQTYVAHGRNSGDVLPTKFSNIPSSLQSSLGFFVTKETYEGNNGYSMRLNGVEKGINDKALDRAIVMHGAAYVNEALAKNSGRIGRSWGCPAVSMQEHREIIDLIKNGSCLFIYAPQQQYLSNSSLAKTNTEIL